MFARSARANARCSACCAPRTPLVDDAAASANQRACAASAPVRELSLSEHLEREGPNAVEQPVSHLPRRLLVDDHERPSGEPPDDIDRRRYRHVERVEHRTRPLESRAPPGKGARAPRDLAGRRGTRARSSTRWSPSGPDVARAAGSSGRSRARSGRRVGGVMSSIDRVRVRAGRQLDRERKPIERATEVVDRCRQPRAASIPTLCGCPATEELDGVVVFERPELEDHLTLDPQRDLARAEHLDPRRRHREGGPRGRLPHRRRARSCRAR